MRRVSLARMGEDRVYKGMNDSSGKGEVEEYAPSFSPGVQMGVIIIIFGAQSSPVKSVHPTFLHSCLVWPEAEARDVPEAPMSALLRPPRAPFVRALTRRTAAWTRPPGSRAAPPPRVSPAPPSGGRLGRAPPRSQRTCAGPFRSSSPAVFNPLTVGLARRAGISCFASLASLLSPLPPALPPPPPLAPLSPVLPLPPPLPPHAHSHQSREATRPAVYAGTAPVERQLNGCRLGRCGRSFSCESHQPGGPE